MNLCSYRDIKALLCLSATCALAALPSHAADSPSQIVQDYYRTLAVTTSLQDLDKFESQRSCKERQSMLKDVPPVRKDKYLKFLRIGIPKTIKINSEAIEGDNAKVFIQAVGSAPMTAAPVQKDPSVQLILQKFGAFFLKREQDHWLIDAQEWDSNPIASTMVNPHEWKSWAQQASKNEFPESAVVAKVEGESFVPDRCLIGPDQMFGGTWLKFQQGGNANISTIGISINLLDEKADVSDRSFEISDGKLSWPKKQMFNIIRESPKYQSARTIAGSEICGMKLIFGKETAAGIPGKIFLRLYSQPETSIAGSFMARKN